VSYKTSRSTWEGDTWGVGLSSATKKEVPSTKDSPCKHLVEQQIGLVQLFLSDLYLASWYCTPVGEIKSYSSETLPIIVINYSNSLRCSDRWHIEDSDDIIKSFSIVIAARGSDWACTIHYDLNDYYTGCEDCIEGFSCYEYDVIRWCVCKDSQSDRVKDRRGVTVVSEGIWQGCAELTYCQGTLYSWAGRTPGQSGLGSDI
jgi:hypothetical protein